MVNILVTACYSVEDNIGMRRDVPFKFDKYRRITDMCVKSFCKNLEGIDDVVVLEGVFENYHRMFQDIYYKIREIYQTRKCNILFVDADDLCIRPTRIFGKYDKFVMFDIQNRHCSYRSKKIPSTVYSHLKPWMMSNVRYYPMGAVTEKMWKMGDNLAENWVDVWAYECIIYNTLFHAQGISEKEINETIYDKNLNYQSISAIKSGHVPKSVKIIHLHSARNMDRVIEVMSMLMDDFVI